MKINRNAYWKQKIYFECPTRKGWHTIEECFNTCEFSGASYHDNCAWVKCGVDPYGERELHDGKVTRDN
jgi:hypothetical protein